MYAVVIFIVALAVRLLHVWQLQPTPFFETLLGDARGYDQWAQRLAAGDWVGNEVFYQAPLYPYFLGAIYSLFGRDLLVVRIIQALIGSASCVLLASAGERLFSRRVGMAAGLGLALWAPAIFFDGLLQKSVLDMFFMCLSLWAIGAIVEGRSTGDRGAGKNAAAGIGDRSTEGGNPGSGSAAWVVLGVAMGLLALTRENALLLVIIVAVWAFVRERAQLVPLVAAFALVLTPVVLRNYSIDGRIYLTTSQFGPNFYIGNNPTADGTYASIRFGRGSPEYERIDAEELAEAATGRELSPAEVSSYWTDRAVNFITSQPGDWLRLMGRKVRLLFNRSEMIDTEAQESYAEYSLPLRAFGWLTHFGVLVPLAAIGMIASWPDRRRLWVIYALALGYAASVVMFYVFARYRYPLVPFLLLFATLPFDAKARPFDAKQRSWRTLFLAQGRRWVPLAPIVVVAVFTNVPALDATLMQAISENNLGTALMEEKRYDEAIAHHERAIELMPAYAPAYNNLGAALRAAGRLDDAIARYRQALEIKPDFASASYNLANAQLEQGKAGDSVESFRRALASNPDSVEAHNNLGIALAQRGDLNGAINEFRAALSLDEKSVNAHRNLGNMLFDMGQRAEGLAHLERAAAIAPNEPDATYDIGTILLQDERFAAAASRFEAALKLRPDWAEAHNNLGIALASQGRLADALPHFERAVQLKPDMPDARANRDQARRAVQK